MKLCQPCPSQSKTARKADRRFFHMYSAYARGIDIVNTAYNYLDLVPNGGDEQKPPPYGGFKSG